MLSIALDIITVIFALVTLDALWMLFILYRSFIKALELFLEGNVSLPIQSKWSVLRTVMDVYGELLSEDPIETLVYMPIYSASEPDLGVDVFSSPFLNMMRDGVIDFDVTRRG